MGSKKHREPWNRSQSDEEREWFRQQFGALFLFVGVVFGGAVNGLDGALFSVAAATGAHLLTSVWRGR